jgi:hypothetical protein
MLPLLLPVASGISDYLDAVDFCASTLCCKGVVHTPMIRALLIAKRVPFCSNVIAQLRIESDRARVSHARMTFDNDVLKRQLRANQESEAEVRRTRISCHECGVVGELLNMTERGFESGLYECGPCDAARRLVLFTRVKNEWYSNHPNVLRQEPDPTVCMRCDRDRQPVYFGDDLKSCPDCGFPAHEVEHEFHYCSECGEEREGTPLYTRADVPYQPGLYCFTCTEDQALEEISLVEGVAIFVTVPGRL